MYFIWWRRWKRFLEICYLWWNKFVLLVCFASHSIRIRMCANVLVGTRMAPSFSMVVAPHSQRADTSIYWAWAFFSGSQNINKIFSTFCQLDGSAFLPRVRCCTSYLCMHSVLGAWLCNRFKMNVARAAEKKWNISKGKFGESRTNTELFYANCGENQSIQVTVRTVCA